MKFRFVKLKRSSKPTKKFVAILADDDDNKYEIHFGQKHASDFTHHKNELRKLWYIKRHKVNENWNDPLTAGFWSKHILWNLPTVEESLIDTIKKYKLD